MTNQTINKPSPTCKTCKGTGTKWLSTNMVNWMTTFVNAVLKMKKTKTAKEDGDKQFWVNRYNALLKEHSELKKSYKAQLNALQQLAIYYESKNCPKAKEALRTVILNPL